MSFVETFLLVFIVMSVSIIPAFVFLHELGHAIPILFYTEQTVHIELGKPLGKKKCFIIKKSRLQISIYPFVFIYGACIVEKWEKLSRKEVILCHIGGPIATFISLIVVIGLSVFQLPLIMYNICFATIIFLSMQLIITCIPIKYPNWLGGKYGGNYSDGYKIIHLLKFKNTNRS